MILRQPLYAALADAGHELALASGYIGRDTGPMHLAAAFGKLVLAVFGGGHWPRFTPADAARILTMDVPCQGCGWLCHLPQSYCIREVPVEPVSAALEELLSGNGGNQVRVLARDPALAERMEREAAARSREDIWLLQLEAHEPFLRYEDLLENDEVLLEKVLLQDCGLPISPRKLREAVRSQRFEKLTGGRRRGQEDVTAHERKGIAGDWRNHFTDRVKQAFKELHGDLLVLSGYEKDLNW